MQLVDNYVKTVGSYLPRAQKDDIVKELAENLRSEIEDREGELGRSLTEAEQEAVLKRHGHPLLVAGHYRQDRRSVAFGRQWIGPVLFPFYAKVLSFNLGVSFAVIATVAIALVAAGRPMDASSLISACLLQLVLQFVIVTIIFSLVEQHLTKYPDRWDARRPLRLEPPRGWAGGIVNRVSRLESISQLVASVVFLLWIRAALSSPLLIFGPAAGYFRLAPAWHAAYTPGLLIILTGIAQAVVNLLRPGWVRFRSAVRAGMGAASFATILMLLRAHEWVALGNPANAGYLHAQGIANQTVFYSLVGMLGIALVSFLWEGWRLVRRRNAPVAPRA